jgi:hypothetical protein
VWNNSGEYSAPPFSGVVGSGRWCGANVSSRFIRAGFTGTRRVLVSAVPSAGVGDPAPLLGGPGMEGWIVMGFSPAGEVSRGIGVAVSGMPAPAGEHAISQREVVADDTTLRALLARRVPAVGDDKFAAAPGLLVVQ